MNNLKTLLKKNPVATALLVFLIFLIYQFFARDFVFFDNELLTNVILEGIWAFIVLGLIYIIAGGQTLEFTTKGFGFAFKVGWFLVLQHILIGILFFILKINSGQPFVPNVGLILIEAIVFLIFVGIFEEGLFRGLILNAFLAKDGDSFSGVLKAVLISSFLFGIAHVVPDIIKLFTQPETNTLIVYLLMIAKILQTGMIGFALAVIYIGDHNFWIIALIHAINDMGSAGVNLIFPNAQIGNYVDAASGGITLPLYGVLLLFLLPVVIYAYIQLKRIPLPQWGFFREKWVPFDYVSRKG